jgi:hypothetical protein
LRAIVLSDDAEVIESCASEILLGEDAHQHLADREGSALACGIQRLLGGFDRPPCVNELPVERMHARVHLDDLPRDFIAQLVTLVHSAALPRVREMGSRRIEQAAGADGAPFAALRSGRAQQRRR